MEVRPGRRADAARRCADAHRRAPPPGACRALHAAAHVPSVPGADGHGGVGRLLAHVPAHLPLPVPRQVGRQQVRRVPPARDIPCYRWRSSGPARAHLRTCPPPAARSAGTAASRPPRRRATASAPSAVRATTSGCASSAGTSAAADTAPATPPSTSRRATTRSRWRSRRSACGTMSATGRRASARRRVPRTAPPTDMRRTLLRGESHRSYVHRLIASGGDGKLVELPGADEVPDGERRSHTSEEKVCGRHCCGGEGKGGGGADGLDAPLHGHLVAAGNHGARVWRGADDAARVAARVLRAPD